MLGLSEFLDEIYSRVWNNRKLSYKNGEYIPREVYIPNIKLHHLISLHRFAPDLFTPFDIQCINFFNNNKYFIFRYITDFINDNVRLFFYNPRFPNISTYRVYDPFAFEMLGFHIDMDNNIQTNTFAFYIYSIEDISIDYLRTQFDSFTSYVVNYLYHGNIDSVIYHFQDIYKINLLKHLFILPSLIRIRFRDKFTVYNTIRLLSYHTPRKIGLSRDLRNYIISFLIEDTSYKRYILKR